MADTADFTSFQQLLARLPEEVAASFSNVQKSALEAALDNVGWQRKHPLDMRMRFGIGSKSFYTVLLAGPEKRPEGRRTYETSKQIQAVALVLAAFLFSLQFALIRHLF
jgi:hypothetical protein